MQHIADIQTVYCLMTFNKNPQIQTEIYQYQEKTRKTQRALGDVRQDNGGFDRRGFTLRQPAAVVTPSAAEGGSAKTARIQNLIDHKMRKEKFTVWLDPIDIDKIRRKARKAEASLSSIGREALKKGLKEEVDLDYSISLKPLIEATIDRRMIARDNRMASLLVRACIAIEQTRSISVNVLGRQPARTPNPIKPDVLNDILDHSMDDAKKKITNRSPELKELIKELNSWIVDQEK